ncbi:hypothetical protein DVH26_05710 [Paenibacillus sp. H1-7]|uniref:hypothetical protein n=1 Tax=Paenibacillus sp. H1-7 TaxID=2282849 RepID=UPI001EF81D45|nr:hypothetical protein [Paenibacillus sp. H1-7]ULL13986.1 hypothetical protein DVH26_05710 [Paenibacillus sp. H1-7]
MSGLMVIDSPSGLIDYIIEYELESDEIKSIVAAPEDDFLVMHFGLALLIRHNFVLTDNDKVPHLIEQYYDYKDYKNKDKDRLFLLHPDDISYDISVLIRKRLLHG